MEAKDAIQLELVQTNLNVATKDQALHALAQLLYRSGNISDVDGFVEDVYLREKEGQTGIGNYVAIPHGKSDYVNTPAVAIGINNTEIPWESLDGKGVRVIILFAVGSDSAAAKEHLKLLSLFARKLGNDDVVGELLKARTNEDVLLAFG